MHIKNFLWCFAIIILTISSLIHINGTTDSLAQSKDVQAFIDEMGKTHHYDVESLKKLFQQLQPDEHILKLNKLDQQVVPWDVYYQREITPLRVQMGVKFFHEHYIMLKRAAERFGVPPELIAAILGVESTYGHNPGKYLVFKTLATLAFQDSAHADYFKRELSQFLLLTREEGLDPLSVKGSYAGAIGPAQFMPSNLRAYSEGRSANQINNLDNSVDLVGKFLKTHGWQSGQPVAYPAEVSGKQFPVPKKRPYLSPPTTLEEWIKRGVSVREPLPEKGLDLHALVKLLVLEGKNGPEY